MKSTSLRCRNILRPNSASGSRPARMIFAGEGHAELGQQKAPASRPGGIVMFPRRNPARW